METYGTLIDVLTAATEVAKRARRGAKNESEELKQLAALIQAAGNLIDNETDRVYS